MTYHHPSDEQIELYGATLIPRNWDASGEPADDVSVHTMPPERPIEARLLLEN